MIRISNIKINIKEATTHHKEIEMLRNKIISKLNIKASEPIDYKIFKKSIDARKKDTIYYIYTVDVQVPNEQKILRKYGHKGITITPDMTYKHVPLGTEKMEYPPVIIGMGPAGLFAGLILSKLGYSPILLERGEEVDTRTVKVHSFWMNGKLDPESNVQFGEGGAGTFSDGKLTTLIHDKRCRKVLEKFIQAGAPEEILYTHKPHVGTDLLKTVVKNIRKEIIQNGGEVKFKSRVTDFIIKNNHLEGLIINNLEKLPCKTALLGIGHSARDTFQVLHQRGIRISQKPFSMGVRIEHPQEFINQAQYGNFDGYPGLEAADYKLVYHSKNGRSAYTFCMCPGGYVIGATSEKESIAINGMSHYKRDGKNANSALLVNVTPADYDSTHPLAGIDFQRKWEKLAYQIGGKIYYAPVQLIGDFLADKPSTQFGTVMPTYKPNITFAALKNCLPDYVINTLKESLIYFDTIIKGFAMPDGILTGVETRSSSPIRINRDENHMSNVHGLYPMGEGAGYAGGIMSSAVDGIRTAEKIISMYSPLYRL
jgi:uncharacterized FAD-dependent dehydrogenase